jgi:hypothetical protein
VIAQEGDQDRTPVRRLDPDAEPRGVDRGPFEEKDSTWP